MAKVLDPNLKREINQEELVEAAEVRLLMQAVQFLQQALNDLNKLKNPSGKASIQALNQAAMNMSGEFSNASNNVLQAINMLKNSLGDENSLRNLANDIGAKAVANKNAVLATAEKKAFEIAEKHSEKIQNTMRRLEVIREQLDNVKNFTIIDMNRHYPNLVGIGEKVKPVLNAEKNIIRQYANELNALFNFLETTSGRRPFWKFW